MLLFDAGCPTAATSTGTVSTLTGAIATMRSLSESDCGVLDVVAATGAGAGSLACCTASGGLCRTSVTIAALSRGMVATAAVLSSSFAC